MPTRKEIDLEEQIDILSLSLNKTAKRVSNLENNVRRWADPTCTDAVYEERMYRRHKEKVAARELEKENKKLKEEVLRITQLRLNDVIKPYQQVPPPHEPSTDALKAMQRRRKTDIKLNNGDVFFAGQWYQCKRKTDPVPTPYTGNPAKKSWWHV